MTNTAELTDFEPLKNQFEILIAKCPDGGGRLRAILATMAQLWPFYGQLSPAHLAKAFHTIGSAKPVEGERIRITKRRSTCRQLVAITLAAYKAPVDANLLIPNYEQYRQIWLQIADHLEAGDDRMKAIAATARREAEMFA